MRPLNIAFLWHQHQPYYRMGDSFVLPWVRLHAVKDYTDLLLLFEEFPTVKHTVNIVPSLLLQLMEYGLGVTDRVQELTLVPAHHLTRDEQQEIAQRFVLCQHNTMIAPYPRYAALANAIATSRWHAFSTRDWLDLQTWYALTWVGPVSRTNETIARLIRKGEGFTEEEKRAVLDVHMQLIGSMIPTLDRLRRSGQIDVSVTPYMHPILPLICSTDAAREAMPYASLPDPPFTSEVDAVIHVERACAMYADIFGAAPVGMWPAEGSVSMRALGIMAAHNISWAATDEAVLQRSLGSAMTPASVYRPWTVNTEFGEIALLFRDHALSDAIGFEYHQWDSADAAAANFVERLAERRRLIVAEFGEEALDHAVVPVILDGENCWEFYVDNGAPFLRALFTRLSADERFTTVTCTEATRADHAHVMPTLDAVVAGSWIDGNFDIWIGSPEKNLAWSTLRHARAQVTNDPAHAAAFEALLIAEGSDWWWWYDHRHQAPNKYDFDVLFRYYIRTVYLVTGAEPPIDLDRSLYEQVQRTDDSATYVIPVTYPMSTMHRSNVAARDITVDRTETATRVTLSLARPLGADEELAFTVNGMSAPERVDSGTLRHTLPPGTKSISVVVEEHASHGSPLVFQREHI